MTLEDWAIKCSGLSREEYFRQKRAFRRREMFRQLGDGIMAGLAFLFILLLGYLFLAVV